jgi:hypothetical protein
MRKIRVKQKRLYSEERKTGSVPRTTNRDRTAEKCGESERQ